MSKGLSCSKHIVVCRRRTVPWWYNSPAFDRSSVVDVASINNTLTPPEVFSWYQSTVLKTKPDAVCGGFPRRHDDSPTIIVFSGTEPGWCLGAELRFSLGGEIHVINRPCVVTVPRGMEYGGIVTSRLERPYFMTEILPLSPYDGCSLDELETEPHYEQHGLLTEAAGGVFGPLFREFEDVLDAEIDLSCGPYSGGRTARLHFELISSAGRAGKPVTAQRDLCLAVLSTDCGSPDKTGAQMHCVIGGESYTGSESCMIFIPAGTSYVPPWFTELSRPLLYGEVGV